MQHELEVWRGAEGEDLVHALTVERQVDPCLHHGALRAAVTHNHTEHVRLQNKLNIRLSLEFSLKTFLLLSQREQSKFH